MRLDNRTQLSMQLLTIEFPDEPAVRAVLIAKATYDLDPDGRLRWSAEQLPITRENTTTPFGIFHGDIYPRKHGADLCVLGTLRRTTLTAVTEVSIAVGTHVNRLRISGDRHWRRSAFTGRLVPSAPEPFTEMPLTYTRAFGGPLDTEAQHGGWPDNPHGVGFYMDAQRALQRPLPNIESADGPFVSSWEDRPPVVGWGPYPMYWGLRVREGTRLNDERTKVQSVSPRLFNHAHPALVLPRLAPGDRVCLNGVWPRELAFPVPNDMIHVTAMTGATEVRAVGELDGLFLWLDARKVVVTQRARFNYIFRRGEARAAVITVPKAA